MERTISVHRTGIFGTTFPLTPVHFDWSAHFSQSDRNFPFRLTKLLSPVPLCYILLVLTGTITKLAFAWVESVLPECSIALGTWNFRNFCLMKKMYLINKIMHTLLYRNVISSYLMVIVIVL